MSKKMGRPPTPKSKAKTEFLGAFVDPKESKTIHRAITESGQSRSEWIRSALAQAARPIWIISKKWQSSDLRGKTVEFKFTLPDSWFFHGVWRFQVRHHRDRVRIAVEIESTEPVGSGLRWHVFYLPQHLVDSIERHSDTSVAEFRCFESVAGLTRSAQS